MSNGNQPVSRRTFLSSALKGAAVVPVAASMAASGSAMAKSAQSDVQYQEKPKNSQKCKNCKFWEGDGKCKKVKGDISASGWCALWQPTG